MKANLVNVTPELSIHADAGEIRQASKWLEVICAEHRVPAPAILRLDLCLHEVLANIIFHGAGITPSSRIDVRFKVLRSDSGRAGEAQVTVSDAGLAFDPLRVQPPPKAPTLSEAEPGGLGLVMIRGFADGLYYRYNDGRNELAFSVAWKETDPCNG